MKMFSVLFILGGGFLFWLSRALLRPQNYGFISGFNSLSEKEKIQYGAAIASDTSKVLAVAGILTAALGIWLTSQYLFALDFNLEVYIVSALLLSFSFFLLRKKSYPFMQRPLAIALGALFIGVAGYLVFTHYRNSQEPVLYVGSDKLRIDAMYGTNVDLTKHNIKEVILEDGPLDITSRVKGYRTGNVYNGRFKLGTGETAFVYVVSNKGPVLHIVLEDHDDIYLAAANAVRTRQYLDQVRSHTSTHRL